MYNEAGFSDWVLVIVLGAIIGWIASIIVRTGDQMGCLWNIVIGIAGAALGRWLAASALGLRIENGFSLGNIGAGIVGAVVLIAVLQAFGILRRRG
ncbi:MAG: GlsB/YeaQ/YmgE family stress response membrane protein [bacterium]|nr:GlsB/YeaQ/YmgE family stress response membrane protein [Candidatus Kapabacteria bacterium]